MIEWIKNTITTINRKPLYMRICIYTSIAAIIGIVLFALGYGIGYSVGNLVFG